jgi:hypothetical protein
MFILTIILIVRDALRIKLNLIELLLHISQAKMFILTTIIIRCALRVKYVRNF